MNTKTLNKLLEQYKSVDLEMAILNKQKELIKQKLKTRLEEESMDSLALGEFKVSLSSYERIMYIKKSLEKYVDSKILEKCKKTINVERTTVSYEK